jgi:hypothetical protein
MNSLVASSGDFDDVSKTEKTARHFLESGYFKDLRSVSQGFVKIMKGRELGIGSFTACDQINMINGKPTLNANLLAALIRNSKKYDYDIIELSNTVCSIAVTRDGQKLNPVITFTIEDAKRAGLTRNSTYNAYPQNMLFARCISNAARFHCPDITTGIYVPEDFPEVSFSDTPTLQIAKIPEKPIAEIEDLLEKTKTSLADINAALGLTLTTIEEIQSEPFVISYLKTKKESMGL